jgi:hypothetical protein
VLISGFILTALSLSITEFKFQNNCFAIVLFGFATFAAPVLPHANDLLCYSCQQ